MKELALTLMQVADSCGKKLPIHNSHLNIVTSISEHMVWSRLHVQIVHRSGIHNDATTNDADVCQKCAIRLLTDLERVKKKGERATEGAESIDQEGWNA